MKRLRCAVYTRKSTDEGLGQDFNSLDAQREACTAYIKSQAADGWVLIPRCYDDGGFSGGSLERPALQALLADVKAKRVDIVVVHKIDRLTRSLLDFAKLVEVLEASEASFVSVTQSFNTTTSMGRLTLNMLLSFAQFEREITAERIRDKIAASKAKGMWMGGNPPLGYEPAGRSLKIVDAHAKLIVEIFERYVATGNVRLLEYELDRKQIRLPRRIALSGRETGGGKFSRGQLYKILSNPVYRGKIAHHEKLYEGQHDAIVGAELWNAAHHLLRTNRQGYHATKRPNAILLAGLVETEDGRRFKSNHACKGRKRYRYYVVDQASDAGVPGNPMRIPNGELDAAVSQLICEELQDPFALLFKADVELRPSDIAGLEPRAQAMLAAVDQRDYFTVRSLIRKVIIGSSYVEVQLDVSALLNGLAIAGVPHDDTIALKAAARTMRTGKAVRLVQQNGRSPNRAKPNLELARHIVKAREWWSELKSGDIRIADIARREGLNPSWVSRMVRLNFLAPPVVEAIFAGTLPDHLGPDLLRHPDLPLSWQKQLEFLAVTAHKN